MKKNSTFLKLGIIFIVMFSFNNYLFAQGDVSELVQAGKVDASKLAQAYLNPFFKGIGFGMNSAWYNSAKTKNLGKFDLKIQATGAFVPSGDRTFDVSKLGLTNVQLSGTPSSSLSPTAFGKDDSGPTLELINDNNVKFDLPSGSGFHIVPSPQVQLTVGLIKNTDVSLRFIPKVGGGDFGKVGSWGFGIKKEITSLLPGKSEKLIPVDISLAFGYNQINYDYKIATEDQVGNNQTTDQKQRVEGKFSGYTIDAILSKKLAVFTPFVSIGYNSSKTDLGVLGTYTVDSGSGTTEDLIDPIKINQNDINGVRANVGFSLHLVFFRLYGAYSVGDYQAVSAGIGFGIGK